MRVSHSVSAEFDDPNLVSCAGLAPVLALAERCGLHRLVSEHVSVPGEDGANPHLKIPALVAGMVAGADSIDDMDLLRHGGMGRLFGGIRAPSTLGIFLRAFTFGHVRQLDAIAARFLGNLAAHTPLLPGAGGEGGGVVFVDIDDTVRQTYGYAKQGAGYGYSKVKGLNALIATASTPTSAPVVVGTRLRRGNVNSAKGAHRLLAEALKVVGTLHHRTGSASESRRPGLVLVRADSAYYNHKVIAAIRRGGARFSITARQNKSVRAAIASIAESAWIPIKYPHAIYDEAEQRWVSDAEVAEIPYTAFTSKKKSQRVTGRLLVRRVKRLNPTSGDGTHQGELFTTPTGYRYHAVFTDSPLELVPAEATHRDHAIIEQVIAELKGGPVAHLPSSRFNTNGAWLVLAAIALNLTRATGVLTSTFHARARTATIRTHLINVPARIATSARRITLHLPQDWPWEHEWMHLFNLATADPPTPLPA